MHSGYGLKPVPFAEDHTRLEVWQGLKPGFFLGAFCGTTEVMPSYKARFDGAGAAT
jgi:hypothetical protein